MQVVYQSLYFSRVEHVIEYYWGCYAWDNLNLTASVWMIPKPTFDGYNY